MSEESWHSARLIPTSGISGAEEQERRATSALLAVLMAVKEFNRTLLAPFGAPAGTIECFIEVPFKLGERDYRPDGLIRAKRGAKTWTALVEVKTGKNDLLAPQLEAYLDIARGEGFDSLITISNEIPANPVLHPTVGIDKRKLKRVQLHHLSWSHVLSQAVMQKEHRGVADPDQAWILGELIRYLEHPKSGALDFDDMGPDWVTLREAVAAGTLRATDSTIAGVTSRFDAMLRYTALHLGRRLGTEVTHQLNRKESADPALRAAALKVELVGQGTLSGFIRVPGTVGDIQITADLRSSKVTCQVDLESPKTGRPATRVNWLTRQLKEAPGSVRVEAFVANQRGQGASELLGVVRDDPSVLIIDPTKDVRGFRVASASNMGSKRGRGRGGFIDSVIDSVDDFYQQVLQQLKPWSAAPPKLRDEPELPTGVPASLVSTALSSQDDPTTESPLGDDERALVMAPDAGSTDADLQGEPTSTEVEGEGDQDDKAFDAGPWGAVSAASTLSEESPAPTQSAWSAPESR
ncbi:MAG: hypothetical protein NTV23_09515 [Propionibacteriales bacterium]|nr:hypothetical protein [Propionibacteriales bacterium]